MLSHPVSSNAPVSGQTLMRPLIAAHSCTNCSQCRGYERRPLAAAIQRLGRSPGSGSVPLPTAVPRCRMLRPEPRGGQPEQPAIVPTGSQLSGVLPETLVRLSATLPSLTIPPPPDLASLSTILLDPAVSVPSL